MQHGAPMSLPREASGIEAAIISLRHDLTELERRVRAAGGPRSAIVAGMLSHCSTRLVAVQKLLHEACEFAPDSLRLDS